MVCLSGIFLALHFWTWFESLSHTSAFRSTLLVCLNPFWIAIWEQLSGKKQSKNYWLGGGISFLGVCIMSIHSAATTTSMLGDLLACVGGMLGAAYFIVGKKARVELDIYQYGSGSCLFSALTLFLIAVFTDTPLSLSSTEWIFAIYMALGPQLCGHIGLNYVLKYVRASFLSMLLLFEPVGAGILAFFLLAESPTTFAMIGGILVIGGLTVTVIDNDKKNTKVLEKNID